MAARLGYETSIDMKMMRYFLSCTLLLMFLSMDAKCGQPYFDFYLCAQGHAIHLENWYTPWPQQPSFQLNLGDSLLIETYMPGGYCGSHSMTLMRGDTPVPVQMPQSGFPTIRIGEAGTYTVWATTQDAQADNSITFDVISSSISRLFVRALLQGPPYSNGWMSGLLTYILPNTEPYSALGFAQVGSGGESASDSAFNNLQILDWVLIEFRDALQPATIVGTRMALIDATGDIIYPSNLSRFVSPAVDGTYYIAIRHRNHLAAMTATAINLTGHTSVVDFGLPATPTWGTDARKIIGNTALLWAGNTKSQTDQQKLKYIGANNDRDPILTRIGGIIPTSTASGYYLEDTNLDGVVKYTGANNDRDIILQNIGGSVPTAVRFEQLP